VGAKHGSLIDFRAYILLSELREMVRTSCRDSLRLCEAVSARSPPLLLAVGLFDPPDSRDYLHGTSVTESRILQQVREHAVDIIRHAAQ
jgi:hypothetical protein